MPSLWGWLMSTSKTWGVSAILNDALALCLWSRGVQLKVD